MRRLAPLLSATLIALVLAACTKDPYAEGKKLGDRHADLVRAGTIEFEQIAEDVEEARAPFAESAESKAKFDDGYREGVRPVRAELAAMAMEAAGEAAGQAIGDVLEGVGEGFGRAVSGFMRGVSGEKKAADAPADEDTTVSDEEAKEQMKALGRGLGKVMKQVSEGVEAMADGVEEELEKSE